MASLVDPKTGQIYEAPAGQEDAQMQAYGLQPATPEQVAAYDAQKNSGGFGSQVQTVGEEAIRASAALIPGVDAGAAPGGLTELEPGQAENPLTGVYSDEARERREVNPIAAGIGNSLPGMAAGLALPAAGAAGLAVTLGLDAASGYAQEAVDAELENRDIRGEDVLRNAGLNSAFSLGAMGLGAAARASLKGGRNLLERAADAARASSKARAATAEGAELAEAVADTGTRDELLSSLATRSDEAVNKAISRLETAGPPRVANNPNAQKAALEGLLDSFEKSDPSLVSALREFEKGPAGSRLEGLRQARTQLSDDSELGKALDGLIAREDLWGTDALGASASIEAALKLRPPPGAPAEDFIEFASAVRNARGGEFAGLADQIEQLAERAAEVRVAGALGDTAPAAAKGVDYAKAMASLDPTEAWRLTREGADEGLRKVEANTVADAFQRVDDTLKEDVAMSVKRGDFVAGAEKWSPAQIEKQSEWLGARAVAPEPPAPHPGAQWSLEGKTHEDLGADKFRPEALETLRNDPTFAATGAPGPGMGRTPQGDRILLKMRSKDGTGPLKGEGLFLIDGSHRLQVAREKGLTELPAEVLDSAGNVVYKGPLPIAAKASEALPAPKGTGLIGKLESLLDDARRSKGSNPESGYALGGYASDTERAINQALQRVEGADPITRNYEIDQLKRTLDGIASRLGKADQGVDQSAKAFGVKRLLEVSDELRRGLEEAELFGRNAGLQSQTNAAWKKLIDPYSRVKKRMSDFLGREFGNVGAESGNIIRYNPDDVERVMQTFDRNFRTDLDQAIKGIDQMMSARQQSGLSHLDQLGAARADLQRIKEGFEFADVLRVAKSKAKEPAAMAVAKRALGGGSGAVAGAVVGGVPGAIGGAALGVAAERGLAAATDRVNLLKPGSESPFTQVMRKHLGLSRKEQAKLLSDPAFAGTLPESLKRASMAVGDGSGTKAVELATEAKKAAVRETKHTAALMVNPEAARRALRLAGDAGSALARFQGENDNPRQAFLGYRQQLDGFARNPEEFLQLLGEEFGDISDMSPKLQREATIQATKVVAYLQEHMPGRRNTSVVYPNGTPASSMEIRQFALRFTAATDPASVQADARAGRLQKVQLDTLQALWPREYDGLRAEVLQQLGTGKASTNTRQRMSLLFNFGSGVDPALGARTRAIVQAARAAQLEQSPEGGGGQPGANTSKAVAAGNTPAGMASLQLSQQLTF